MIEIKFYHNAPDRLMAACSITAKAVRQGRRVLVYAPDEAIARRYDHLLWSAQPLSFVPHVGSQSPLAARTPVVIASDVRQPAHEDILLNLGSDLPAQFERFGMLVEIVSRDGEDVQAARARWKRYKEQAFPVTAYDLAKSE